MKTALVTGGSGYFGSLLSQNLLKENWNVKNLDINPPDQYFEGNYKYIKGDIKNLNKLEKEFDEVDCVFHNVALVPLTKSSDYVSTNLLGTKNVIELAVRKKVNNFIYTSSSAVFGVPENNPVSEHTLPKPAEEYGKSKFEAEFLVSTYSNKINVNIIRPRTILGHGRLGIFQILFDWIKKGWNVPILGSGDNIYQFVHSDDLVKACILASNSEGLNYYNVGSQDYCSMRETLEALCDYAKTGSKVISLPFRTFETLMNISSNLGLSPLGSYHSLMYGRSLYFDTTKIEDELGWESKFSNKEAIIDSYNHYLNSYGYKMNQNKLSKNNSPHKSNVKQGVLKLLGLYLSIF